MQKIKKQIKKQIKYFLTCMGFKKWISPFPNQKFDPDIHNERVKKWQSQKNDVRLRQDYPDLNKDSILLDLGGFYGQFSIDMNEKYGCTCHIFEVIPEYCKKINKSIKDNKKIYIHQFGLAGNDRKEELYIAERGSSLFYNPYSSGKIPIQLKKASEWIDSEYPNKTIDLIKINIEGAEYELLEHLIETGKINMIKNIQVQFHEDAIPNAKKIMKKLQRKLSKTHQITFQQIFIWENWELINK